MLVFRGTRLSHVKGRLQGASYTTALPIALIWSARPPNPWGSKAQAKAAFVPHSTVHFARLDPSTVLELYDSNHMSMEDVLLKLRFGEPDGITAEETEKVFHYLTNRLSGRAPGGEFRYRMQDMEDENIEGSIFTFASEHYRRFYWDSDDIETARGFIADTFIFADSPTVQKVAARLGYKVLSYPDVCGGCEQAVEDLFDLKDVYALRGIFRELDVEFTYMPTHTTLREIVPGGIVPTGAIRSSELLRRLKPSDLLK
jgi:hypothetical protein